MSLDTPTVLLVLGLCMVGWTLILWIDRGQP